MCHLLIVILHVLIKFYSTLLAYTYSYTINIYIYILCTEIYTLNAFYKHIWKENIAFFECIFTVYKMIYICIVLLYVNLCFMNSNIVHIRSCINWKILIFAPSLLSSQMVLFFDTAMHSHCFRLHLTYIYIYKYS